jgi:hypothetical protein
MATPLEKAQAAMAAKRAAGIEIERLNPAEKAAKSPASRSLAIAAKCFDCVGGENADGGFRRCIRECPSTKCALYQLRPYKRDDAQEVDAA